MKTKTNTKIGITDEDDIDRYDSTTIVHMRKAIDSIRSIIFFFIFSFLNFGINAKGNIINEESVIKENIPKKILAKNK